jgi:4-hydroxy-4-methyl-2-oxoglutarate aldolase
VLELAGITSAIAADALDGLGRRGQALAPDIRPLWTGARVVGRAMPVVVRCSAELPSAPYDGEMRALDALTPGDVAVFEVERGVRAAAWGELFSCGAIGSGAVGVVVDGFVRDARQIEELGFPTFARGCSPLDTLQRAAVSEFGEAATCGGVLVRRGDVIVGDIDGVVAIPSDLVQAVAQAAQAKHTLEDAARADLRAGMSIRAVWEKYRVF